MRRFDTSLGLLLVTLITGSGSALAQDETPLPATGYLPPGLSSTDLEPAESGSPDSAGFGSPFRGRKLHCKGIPREAGLDREDHSQVRSLIFLPVRS